MAAPPWRQSRAQGSNNLEVSPTSPDHPGKARQENRDPPGSGRNGGTGGPAATANPRAPLALYKMQTLGQRPPSAHIHRHTTTITISTDTNDSRGRAAPASHGQPHGRQAAAQPAGGRTRPARPWPRTPAIRESIRKSTSDRRRDTPWTESIRKCEGKSLYNPGKANVLVL